MAIEYIWLNAYMPIFAFLFVFIMMYAIFYKTKLLGENAFINSIVSFIFAIVFITFSPGIDFVETIIPWFVILIICLFFVMILVGFSQNDVGKFMKGSMSWVFVGLLVLIFLISAIVVFNPVLSPYLPGQPDTGGETFLLSVKHFVYGERFLGALLLFIIAGVASWILAKEKSKK